MEQDQQGYVKSTLGENRVRTIEFFHPAHNSLPGYLLADLASAITVAGSDPAARVILLQSAGDRTFCAGASFEELIAIDSPESGKRFFMGFANVINACRKCPKLIVGRVQGKAVGGGVGLAAAVDYCISTKYANIKLSELALGIGPFVVGPAVERKIGLSAFSQLTVNATEWQPAGWAEEKGLFQHVFSSIEEMDVYLHDFLDTLTMMNPEAMTELKRVFWKDTEHWDELLDARAEMSGRLVLSEFTKSAIEQIKMKNA
jgi:methylglutaconyl-CoA hydratase